MAEYFDELDPKVADHISSLRKSVKIEDDGEALETLARAWKEKEDAFVHQILVRKMEMVDEFDPYDENGGVLLLTYSGSLLSVGPIVDGKRTATYASIGMREDVPEFAESEDAVLDAMVQAGESVKFKSGPVKSSSPIYKMAVFSDELEAEDEEEQLAEVTQILAEDFTEVNRTIIAGE